jgi:hypothetical protein
LVDILVEGKNQYCTSLGASFKFKLRHLLPLWGFITFRGKQGWQFCSPRHHIIKSSGSLILTNYYTDCAYKLGKLYKGDKFVSSFFNTLKVLDCLRLFFWPFNTEPLDACGATASLFYYTRVLEATTLEVSSGT